MTGRGEHDTEARPLTLTLVVNGRPTRIATSASVPLRDLIPQALEQANPSSKAPADQWEARNVHGVEIPLGEPIGTVNFGSSRFLDGPQLWLTLRAGVGA